MLTRHLVRHVSKRRSSSTSFTSTTVPKYPQILDLSNEAKNRRERERYRDRINAQDTVEEKLFFQNLRYYYGTKCYWLEESKLPIDSLSFVKYITRTRSVEADLKSFQQLMAFNSSEVKELLERIRPYLQEALLFELLGRTKENLSEEKAAGVLVERINDVLLSSLSMQYQHLLDATVDYNPRLEAFWLAGNFHPSVELYKERTNEKKRLEKENKRKVKPEPIDIDPAQVVEHHIQYIGHPLVQLRSKLPLTQLDTDMVADRDPELDKFLSETYYSPSLRFGLQEIRRFGTNLPGFWPGDECEHGLISYHYMKDVNDVPDSMVEAERRSRLKSQAILSGFGWLHAQAALLGFSTYQELTYPLTSQQVITDGRQFSFNLYQLNTTLIHKELNSPNTRTNICVSLPIQPLYQEISNNQFVGWNDEVILNLLGFYLNKPEARDGVDMKPFINPAIRVLAEVDDEDRRIWLHNQFRHMYSNRPRHRVPYEIYDWERIYKIEYSTREMDARMRPYERGQNPMDERKYWDAMPPYVPKKDRPKKKQWNGWKSKFAKTYFPDP
uniref:28S ribosomal protein S30, mitochondrial n=1 Tax=Lygus hesperus TaxID=30085 RepID=A0A0K8SKB9_LYGHE